MTYIYQLKWLSSPSLTTCKGTYDELVHLDRIKWGFCVSDVAVGHWFLNDIPDDLVGEILEWTDYNMGWLLAKRIPLFRSIYKKKLYILFQDLLEIKDPIAQLQYIFTDIAPYIGLGKIYYSDFEIIFQPNELLKRWLPSNMIRIDSDSQCALIEIMPGGKNLVDPKLTLPNVMEVTTRRSYLSETFHYHGGFLKLPYIEIPCYGGILERPTIYQVKIDDILNDIDDLYHYYYGDMIYVNDRGTDDNSLNYSNLQFYYPYIINAHKEIIHTCSIDIRTLDTIDGNQVVAAWEIANTIKKYVHILRCRDEYLLFYKEGDENEARYHCVYTHHPDPIAYENYTILYSKVNGIANSTIRAIIEVFDEDTKEDQVQGVIDLLKELNE